MRFWKTIALVLLATVVAGVVYGTMLIRRGFSARAQPSDLEKIVAHEARNMAISAKARNAENPWKDHFTPELMAYTRHHFADQLRHQPRQ